MAPEDKVQLTQQYNAVSAPVVPGTAHGLVSVVDNATRNGQHVFFGEPHLDGMIIKQYAVLAQNPQLFKVAAQNGIKNLALEFPSGMQQDVDNFVAGKISATEFKKNLNDGFISPWLETEHDKRAFQDHFTQTIQNAKDAGMKVHFADVSWQKIMHHQGPPEVQAWEKRLTEKYQQEKPSVSLQDYALAELEKMPQQEKEHLIKIASESIEDARHARFDDTEQYSYLRERIPHGEGIMGVVGMSHLDNNLDEKRHHKTMGIDDYLTAEGARVTTIEMHTSNTTRTMKNEYDRTGAKALDRPDYTVVLDKNVIMDKDGGLMGQVDKPMPDRTESDRYASQKPAVGLPAYQ